MVVGEQVEGGEALPPSPQQYPPQKASIENIMSGIENTGAVKMNNHRKKLRQRFDIIKKLGQGTYGKVQLGINKETGQEVAIKTIKKSKIETEADLIRIRREVQIMSSVQHPNIIHIYEVFENREKMVLVMEFAAGGELYDYLSERKVLAEEEARRIFRQVSTAIYYCHKHKICHRDLKLENILLDENGNAKIADFGLSNVFDDQRLLATFCGSPLYASPEIVKGTPYQGPEVDCWSLGVLLYTLVYGAMPFDGANFKRLVKQISQGDYFEPKKPSRASPLIREMLTVCPRQRASVEQICNHWWVNEGYDESCLDLAEELANQTPVRLDVLLSLAPPSVTADQLLVGNGQDEASKAKDRIQRSHSVGSIVDMGGTEAERRILDMVAAGGEAALMPSPTRTITPAEAATGSPAQTKRKLETTVSTENATGAVKKKDKADPSPSHPRIPEVMDLEEAAAIGSDPPPTAQPTDGSPSRPEDGAGSEATHASPTADKFEAQEVLDDLQNLENMCDELLLEATTQPHSEPAPEQQPEPLPSEPAAANGVAQSPVSTPDVTHKTVSSVRAKLEKLEKPEPEQKPAFPVAPRKVFGKNKTTDLTSAIHAVNAPGATEPGDAPGGPVHRSTSVERKSSLPEESLARTAERRKSRILETAEKFQNMNQQQQAGGNEKFKKFVLPGGGVPTVGNYKKEFERKTGLSSSATFTKPPPATLELQQQQRKLAADQDGGRQEPVGSPVATPPSTVGSGPTKSISSAFQPSSQPHVEPPPKSKSDDEVKDSDSKSSVGSFSLEEARRSMENSIALLNKVKPVTPDTSAPSTPTMEQLCSRTESFSMLDEGERERKLKNAREIIGNAIPIGRLRKPPMPFGANGRSTTGTLGINKPYRFGGADTVEPRCDTMSTPRKVSMGSIPSPPKDETKTSHAEITLKSATLPRRKLSANKPSEVPGDGPAKTDQRVPQQQQQSSAFAPMRFSTEFQHQIPDLRSAPIGRDLPPAFGPMAYQQQQQQRANSLEPQGRDLGPQKPPAYGRPTYGGAQPAQRGTLSRQSTNESNDSDSNTVSQGGLSATASGQHMASGTVSNSSNATMPIKKSPREFIIPIAVEGGGFVTPRANSLEPSESNASSASAVGAAGFPGMKPRLGRPRRLGSLLSETDNEPAETSSFQRLNRHTSLGRDSDSEEPKFHMMHRLRSSRPSKRGTQTDPNDSASSGEEDDDDGFEILTAENLFSTLLSRVRALTNRLNVNDASSPRFPASRFMNNLRQAQPSFWHQDPFARHMGDPNANAWRHSMSRDLSTDIDSMFSRSGATLPRGTRLKSQNNHVTNSSNNSNSNHHHPTNNHHHHHQPPPTTTPPPTAATTNGSPMRSSFNPRHSYHHQLPSSSNLPSSIYKDLAALAAATPRGGDGSAASGQPGGTVAPEDGGVGGIRGGSAGVRGGVAAAVTEENLDLRDLDLSQLRLSKRDLETLSSITPALSQRVQEQLLAQLPPQQARKLSRTLSMQGGPAAATAAAAAATAGQRLYRRSYSNSAAGSRPAGDDGRRAGSQPRDILSPPPGYQTKDEDGGTNGTTYVPYGAAAAAPYFDLSGTSARYELPSSRGSAFAPLSVAHTRASAPPPPAHRHSLLLPDTQPGRSVAVPSKRLSRFLRPDFFDPPKAGTEDAKAPVEPEGGGGVTLREGGGSRQRRLEQLGSDSVNDRLSYFLEKYKKPDETGPVPEVAEEPRTRRATVSPPPLSAAETLSLLQEQLQDLTNLTSLMGGNVGGRRTEADAEPAVVATTPAGACPNCEGPADADPKPATSTPTPDASSSPPVDGTPATATAAPTVKKTVKVKKVKLVKVAKLPAVDSAGVGGEQPEPPSTVKKVKKADPPSTDVTTPTTTLGGAPKKESKLLRPRSYPCKEPAGGPEGKLSLAAIDPALESSVKGSAEVAPLAAPDVIAGTGTSTGTVGSKIARPKSFPSSKLTATKSSPPKDPPPQPPPVREPTPDKTPTEVASTPAVTVAASNPAPKKVKKVIRIVKKVSKVSTDGKSAAPVETANGKVVNGAITSPEPTEAATEKQRSKSPEKKVKQKGFLASIGQRFEKFRDTSTKAGREKKAAATAAAAVSTGADDATLPDPAVPAMVPTALVKENGAGPVAPGGRKSRIDTVIRNLRERSVGPRATEAAGLTESTLIKRAVSVEEMPGTFNRCGVTKVLGLFRRFEKEPPPPSSSSSSSSRTNHRLLNTKSSSHIAMAARPATAAAGVLETEPRARMYGGARSDTVIPLGPPNGDMAAVAMMTSATEQQQRKLRPVQSLAQSSQIPVKYGCPGCVLAAAEGDGTEAPEPDARCFHRDDGAEHTDGTGGTTAQTREEPDRRGRRTRSNVRALTIDLEQAVHSATEKLKRLQQQQQSTTSSMTANHQSHTHEHAPSNGHSLHNLNHKNNNNQNNNNYLYNANGASMNGGAPPVPLANNNHTHSHHHHHNNNNNNYSYPPAMPCDGTLGLAFNSMANHSNNNNTALTPSSYDSITNYSSGSRSSPYDDASSSTFQSPSEERELYFDSWSVCSDEHQQDTRLNAGGRSSPAASSVSRRHSRLTQAPHLPSVSPVDPDTESVIERIRRKSFYTRFNENKKPAKRASATNLATGTPPGASSSSSALHGLGKEYSYVGSGTLREKSLTRGGSTSYILRPSKEYGGGSSATTSILTSASATPKSAAPIRDCVRLRNNHSFDLLAPTADYHHHLPAHNPHLPHHHHHHHHVHGDSNSINNNTSNTKYTRNTYYETSVPSVYAPCYSPVKRRSSFVAAAGHYSAPTNDITSSSSSSIALDLLKDHHQQGVGGGGGGATITSSSSSTTVSASDYSHGNGGGGGGGGSSSTSGSRTLRSYDGRSSSLLTPSALREARYGTTSSTGTPRYESGTLTKTYRNRTSSSSRPTESNP
ncbi:uncharacterized protein LOC128275365 [Anopheles cruzii]|uniref:uncharacterized protein LOC128275365 n=1 Tax=Anopheles cruzii TaxID=68878 RepID=UPI0022EC54D4|nr:uncharacterized protein LOC128275365 [Anopheles cruzii]